MKASPKKGNADFSLLVKLITVLTFGIVVFVLLKNAGEAHTSIATKNTCKESVQQYAKFKFAGHNLADTGVIKCPVVPVTINSGNEERARKEIAGLMYDCFDQFGAGRYDLFETNRGSTDHYCVVCNKVSFTEPGKTIKGLPEYLSENFVPGTGMTYFQYFKGDSVAKGESATVTDANTKVPKPDAIKLAPFNIDTSVDQAILFTYSKSTGWWDKILAGEIAGTTGIVVGGAVAGFFTGGIGWVAAGAALAAGGSSATIAMVKAPDLHSNWQAGVILLPYDQNVESYLKCDEIPIKQ